MPRRAQLALALILALALAPLAGVTCGIQCLAATPLRPMHTGAAQHHCVRASTCCHSGGPAVCSAADAPAAVAALLIADTRASHDAPALAAAAPEFLPQNGRTAAAHSIDSSPPGQPRAANSIPLRV
jgi:hypothetical protein